MTSERKIFKVAVVGCGRRGEVVVGNLLRDSGGQVKVAVVYDPDDESFERAVKSWNSSDTVRVATLEEAVEFSEVEWVLVFTPNALHKEVILAAFRAGKNVFAEKPLATTVEDCLEIYNAHKTSGKHFMTGFVLRYSKLTCKVKELLDNGKVGKILSIDANENIRPSHGGYIVNSWRGTKALSGPHILEKCSHDIDLLIWFTRSLPSKVAAFASLDFFKPENEELMMKLPTNTFTHWHGYTDKNGNPFVSPKDIKDNYVSIMQFRNGNKAQFQATMSNEIPERKMFFSCTEGTIILEFYSSTVTYQRIGEDRVTINYGADGHGGGDSFIMKELYECMITGREPKSSGNEGLESAVTALMIDKAAEAMQVIDLEPIWTMLGR